MIELHSPWEAMKFAARHRLRGGKVVGIPSVVIVASHVFLPPGTLNISDERIAEEAVLAAAISAAVREAVIDGWITKAQWRALWIGALLRADSDLKEENRLSAERAMLSVAADRAAAAVLGQEYAAINPRTARRILSSPIPAPQKPWSNRWREASSTARQIALSLSDLFAERGIICPEH